MKITTRIFGRTLLFVVIFLCALVFFTPPSALVYFADESVKKHLLATDGFVWRGSARLLPPINEHDIDVAVHWHLCSGVETLVALCITATQQKTHITTRFAHKDSRLLLHDVTIDANLAAVAPLVSPLANNAIATGRARITLAYAKLSYQGGHLWPLSWQGSGTISNLRLFALPGEVVQAELRFDQKTIVKEAQDKPQPPIMHVRSDVMSTNITGQVRFPLSSIDVLARFYIEPNAQNNFTNFLRFVTQAKQDGSLEWQRTFPL